VAYYVFVLVFFYLYFIYVVATMIFVNKDLYIAMFFDGISSATIWAAEPWTVSVHRCVQASSCCFFFSNFRDLFSEPFVRIFSSMFMLRSEVSFHSCRVAGLELCRRVFRFTSRIFSATSFSDGMLNPSLFIGSRSTSRTHELIGVSSQSRMYRIERESSVSSIQVSGTSYVLCSNKSWL
jgi:hypothetical protein